MAKKKQHKAFGIKLNIHPVQFHLSMYIAMAMICLITGKHSGEVIHTAYADTEYHGMGDGSELRESEVRHDLAILSSSKLVTHSGGE